MYKLSLKGQWREIIFGLFKPIKNKDKGSKNFLVGQFLIEYDQFYISWSIRRIRQQSLCVLSMNA